ncbi:MAG: amidohydrolase [Planctomycetota bacterium]
MRAAVSILLSAALAFAPVVASAQPAEMIYHGGTIHTMNRAAPTAEAIAVAGGSIIGVGRRADVEALADGNTRRVDLGGATLLPGFIDGHSHFWSALEVLTQAVLWSPPAGDCRSVADVIAKLRALKERRHLGPGKFVVGFGCDPELLAEKRMPSRAELEGAFPDNPVIVIHVSGHGAMLDGKALAHFKIGRDTPVPAGGVMPKDPATGEPTGLLFETAFLPVFAGMPAPPPDDLMALVPQAVELYAAAGITTAQEGATHADQLTLLREAARRGMLSIDVVSLAFITDLDAIFGAKPPRSEREYVGHLRLGGVKIVADGSPQAKTAYFTTPYLTGGPAGEKEWRGEPTFPPATLVDMVKRVYQGDAQLFVHCNGDAAIDLLLDAHRAAAPDPAADRRTVAVHAQFARPDQLEKFKAFAISPSFYTEHCFYFGDTHVANRGAEQAAGISPLKSARALGLHCTNHTDFNVAPIDQLFTVWTAVNRVSRSGAVIGPDERVTPLAALEALTIDAARQYREDDRKGSLEPGKLADLVILSHDPCAVEPMAIRDIEVMETIKEGKTVWRREAAK